MTPVKLTLVTLMTVILGTVSSAQEVDAQNGPFQRLIPRGRIIQKLRDDLNDGKPFISDPFARPDNRVPAQPPNKMSAAAKANERKSPTPAKSSKAPTSRKPAAVGSGVGSGRKSLDVPDLRDSRDSVDGAFDRDTAGRKPTQRIKLTSPNRTNRPAQPDANDAFDRTALPADAGTDDPMKMKATVGFGMILEEVNKDTFVVTRLKPDGNAIKAGVKRGDQLISIGGVDVDSLRLYDEVTREMDGGDQLEFIVSRQSKGKPREEKMLVQFGEMPDIDELAPSEEAPRLKGLANEKYPTLEAAPSLNPTPTSRRNVTPSFAPPTNSQGMRSVLDSGTENFSAPSLNGTLEELDLPALNGPSLNGPRPKGTSSGGR